MNDGRETADSNEQSEGVPEVRPQPISEPAAKRLSEQWNDSEWRAYKCGREAPVIAAYNRGRESMAADQFQALIAAFEDGKRAAHPISEQGLGSGARPGKRDSVGSRRASQRSTRPKAGTGNPATGGEKNCAAAPPSLHQSGPQSHEQAGLSQAPRCPVPVEGRPAPARKTKPAPPPKKKAKVARRGVRR